MVCGKKPSIGEIIATSVNQIVPLKIPWTYKNVVLYSTRSPIPLGWLKGGFGFETCSTTDSL